MNENFTLAGKGLKYLFLAQILTLVAAVVAIVPVLGGVVVTVLAIVVEILSIVGPYTARNAHPNFKTAFYLAVAYLVVGLISIKPNGFPVFIFLAGLMSIVKTVISFAFVYSVCTASEPLLEAKGDGELARRSVTIWKLFAGCILVTLVCALVSWIPLLNILAVVAKVVAAIVQLVAYVLLIIFYYKASKSLLGE